MRLDSATAVVRFHRLLEAVNNLPLEARCICLHRHTNLCALRSCVPVGV